jgi:hypothetical protein
VTLAFVSRPSWLISNSLYFGGASSVPSTPNRSEFPGCEVLSAELERQWSALPRFDMYIGAYLEASAEL